MPLTACKRRAGLETLWAGSRALFPLLPGRSRGRNGGVFLEGYEAPNALSDGPNAPRLDLLPVLWEKLQSIHRIASSQKTLSLRAVIKNRSPEFRI